MSNTSLVDKYLSLAKEFRRDSRPDLDLSEIFKPIILEESEE